MQRSKNDYYNYDPEVHLKLHCYQTNIILDIIENVVHRVSINSFALK